MVAQRRQALWGVGILVFAGLLYFCHEISNNGIQDIDPEPPVIRPWELSFAQKPANRYPWLPGSDGRCKKTLRIQLDGEYGLGASLIVLVLPGLTMARLYGYTPLIDDRDFNYGRLTDYFQPMQLDCDPGQDWQSIDRVPAYASPGWEVADHIILHRHYLFSGTSARMDVLWTDTFMKESQMKSVAETDRKILSDAFAEMQYLPSEMSFTLAVRPSFRAMYTSVDHLFTLNALLRVEVEKLVRNTRPMRRKGVPLLGAIIRLGDKRIEAGWNPGANAYENFPGYIGILREQAALLSDVREIEMKPIVMIMSDDVEKAIEGLRGVPGASAEFDFQAINSSVDVVALPESDDRYERLDVQLGLPHAGGHSQDDFNRQSTVARVASARTFIRDLYYMSKHTDSLVVSSGSNVGRVALVLAGEEKAYGAPRVGKTNVFESIGGLSRSIDTRWFPCVLYVGCFPE